MTSARNMFHLSLTFCYPSGPEVSHGDDEHFRCSQCELNLSDLWMWLVAEVLRCVPHDCLNSLLQIMNEILHKGVVPSSWRKTLFQMLSKTHRARVPADFRPIAGPLQTYAYCTKSLLIWCLVGLKRRWSNTSLRNNMDSGAVGGLKNICWQQTPSLTKLCWQMFLCGLWALTWARLSIELVGTHYEVYYDMGFHNTWCGHCVWFIGNRKAKSSLNRIPVENLTSKLACGKVAFSAPNCFHVYWKWHWRNGVNNCKIVGWTWATAVSHCWTYDLLITFCCLRHLPLKQPGWWMHW